jgi:hypothetical protein
MNYRRVDKSAKPTGSFTPKPPKRIKRTIQPRRHFKAWTVRTTPNNKLIKELEANTDKDEAVIIEKYMEECDFRVTCLLNDGEGNQEEFDLTNMHERSHHFKSFLFKIFNGKVFIIKKEILGVLEKYYFCDSPHYHYVPAATIYPELSSAEQRAAFKEFKALMEDAEAINGFPIHDERHHTREPIIQQLLVMINNSKFMQ